MKSLKLLQTLHIQNKSISRDDTAVYLRNFGNGKVAVDKASLKFWVERGRFSKEKKTVKNIPVNDVEDLILEGKEIAVLFEDNYYRFVFNDSENANAIYSKILQAKDLPLEKPLTPQETGKEEKTIEDCYNPDLVESPEKKIGQTCQQPLAISQIEALGNDSSEADKIIVEAQSKQLELSIVLPPTLAIIDRLFDVLRNLNGSVDWIRLSSFSNQSEKDAAILYQNEIVSSMDFNSLHYSISKHDFEAVSKETYSILKNVYESFQNITAGNNNLLNIYSDKMPLTDIIHSYYLLNDIILADVVEDNEGLSSELDQFTSLLKQISERGFAFSILDLVDSINKYNSKYDRQCCVDDVRALFRQQLEPMLNKS